jgi:bilirubin oxidase
MKMKNILLLLFVGFGLTTFSQNQIALPDTLTGQLISLTMHSDSVSFLSGRKTPTYGFNQYPYLGPTLIIQKDQPVSITVHNQIGDTTAVHWHGLHVAPGNDGGTHLFILPGQSWNPQFTVLDKASTYWYHPHLHRKTAKQALWGAAGFIIVRDSIESTLYLPRSYGIDDFPIAVQCMQFDSINQIMPRGMQDSILMVNGTVDPFVNLPAQVVRLRLLNAGGERTFNFGFTGNKTFYMIGSDGGLLPAPILSTRIRLSPGERAEILLDLTGLNGQNLFLMSYASELPMGVQGGPTMPMPPGSPPMDSPLNGIDFNVLKISVTATTSNPVTTIPGTLVPGTPILESQANTTRTLIMTAENLMSMDGPFYLNGNLFDMNRIDYHVPLNNTEIWVLQNQTMVAHPFHIHDVQFYILDRDGNPVPPVERGRKDVVLVLPDETVRFITRFEDFSDSIVPYVYHCHILMHEDDGMMGQFLVTKGTSGIDPGAVDPFNTLVYPIQQMNN